MGTSACEALFVYIDHNVVQFQGSSLENFELIAHSYVIPIS